MWQGRRPDVVQIEDDVAGRESRGCADMDLGHLKWWTPGGGGLLDALPRLHVEATNY